MSNVGNLEEMFYGATNMTKSLASWSLNYKKLRMGDTEVSYRWGIFGAFANSGLLTVTKSATYSDIMMGEKVEFGSLGKIPPIFNPEEYTNLYLLTKDITTIRKEIKSAKSATILKKLDADLTKYLNKAAKEPKLTREIPIPKPAQVKKMESIEKLDWLADVVQWTKDNGYMFEDKATHPFGFVRDIIMNVFEKLDSSFDSEYTKLNRLNMPKSPESWQALKDAQRRSTGLYGNSAKDAASEIPRRYRNR